MVNLNPKIFFLFKTPGQKYHIVEAKDVASIAKPRELILRANSVFVVREYAKKQGLQLSSDTARRSFRPCSSETRKKLSKWMRENNPNANGITETHRLNISKALSGTRRGENNNFWGRNHSPESKRKMSMSLKLQLKKKWICGPGGITKRIPPHIPLPEGWMFGRFYDIYRPTDF